MSKLVIDKLANGDVYLSETCLRGGHSEYRQMRLMRGDTTYKEYEKTIKTIALGSFKIIQGIYPR